MNKPSLAARRAALVERCAEQRVGLAYELQALRPRAPRGHQAVRGSEAPNRNEKLHPAVPLLGHHRV